MISKEAIEYIENNFGRKKIVCLTGAGTSSESGIPTFRGEGGLWEKYDPEMYANTQGLLKIFREQPQRLADFVVDFYSLLLKARPNRAHVALSVLEKDGIINSVITQNIDNLHQEAGSRNVIELHGNAYRIRCTQCQQKITLEKDRLAEMIDLLRKNRDSRIKMLKVLSRYFPRCKCNWRYRIDIVLFGEELPFDELSHAYKELDNCKALLLIGTSLLVYPAASLPGYAKQRGVKLIEINSQDSAFSELCDYKIRGRASVVLQEILKILGIDSDA
jgi:NAD-dependent deacetylase